MKYLNLKSLLSIFSNRDRQKYCFKVGDFEPNNYYHKPCWNPKGIEADVIIDKSAAYDYQNNDQYDWNKLIGIFGGLNKNTSVRWGWRYSTKSKMAQFCPYIHSNSSTGREEGKYVEVPLGERFHVKIEILRANQSYKLSITYKGIVEERIIKDSFGSSYDFLCTRNFAYHGGTTRSTKNYCIEYFNIKSR